MGNSLIIIPPLKGIKHAGEVRFVSFFFLLLLLLLLTLELLLFRAHFKLLPFRNVKS